LSTAWFRISPPGLYLLLTLIGITSPGLERRTSGSITI
jgi:hypothetical protein